MRLAKNAITPEKYESLRDCFTQAPGSTEFTVRRKFVRRGLKTCVVATRLENGNIIQVSLSILGVQVDGKQLPFKYRSELKNPKNPF